jgi:two-component system, chemotaxis family, response regulator Rcp1
VLQAPTEILLVEDNPGDALLIREVLLERNSGLVMREACDGELAISLLKGEGQDQIPSRPELILLDLNLPKKDGREVLAQIKTDPDLMQIPVVVLTSSRAQEDISRAYTLHANCYITKPFGFADLQRFVRQIKEFWLEVATVPRER